MKEYIYDEKNSLWYKLIGDYYIPCLTLPEEEHTHIGVWGQRHLQYIKNHKQNLYIMLMGIHKLNSYLADIDKNAEVMFFRLEKDLSKKKVLSRN